ncbi:LysR family transcriptional regulator [Xanthomonas arboricola]|uniref:LysR family transcriptional regulator n=1 Tax=Xanthomonas arboricola TaxID=56448 RepID=UPI000B0A7F80|nr:LysR family transcriptional regulator [Xanthomonas arboricola]
MELLNDMALFVEVVKARGFRGAADALGMPSSTLSRRIGALEKAIGLRLLNRTTRKVEPTEAGRIYFERCKRIVDEARLAHEQLGEMLAQPSGVLRASFPVDFAVSYLAPLIAEFSRRFPGITFEFDLTPRRVDLVSEPFDVAIRMGEPEDSHLIARPLARLPTALYASPGYLKTSGELSEPDDLPRHECIGMSKVNTWTLFDEHVEKKISVGGRFTLNSIGMMRRLATLDLGVTLMPEQIVADEVSAKRLVRVLPQWRGPALPSTR